MIIWNADHGTLFCSLLFLLVGRSDNSISSHFYCNTVPHTQNFIGNGFLVPGRTLCVVKVFESFGYSKNNSFIDFQKIESDNMIFSDSPFSYIKFRRQIQTELGYMDMKRMRENKIFFMFFESHWHNIWKKNQQK